MKEIKLIHILIALILVLLSLAIFQWAKLPRGVPPPAPRSSPEASQLIELPVLHQNELPMPATVSHVKEESSLLEKFASEQDKKPEDPAMRNDKPLL